MAGLAQVAPAVASADPALTANAVVPPGYPREYTGPQLAMIAFSLGGVGAGSIGLGGRGQLRDWEISNRADKGNVPDYTLASIWAEVEGRKPVAMVLESRLLPPYEGQDGLGSRNAPGLPRLESAKFTGEFPLASIEFHDPLLPVEVRLEAGTPFIPCDAEDSGLPVGVLRYRVKNPNALPVKVSIAYSIDNPVTSFDPSRPLDVAGAKPKDGRVNEVREGKGVSGLFMHNTSVDSAHTMYGSFALTALHTGEGQFSAVRGWPAGRWWNSPMLFWDAFSGTGELGPEADEHNSVGAICLQRTIAAGGEADFTFLLAWHFPNRTPARCGWTAPKGHENVVIGNYYAKRFADAWAAAEYAAANLESLQARTQKFATAIRQSTLPAVIKEAAMANLSTLVSTTCFRTADGEFHGFEGADDKSGCCFGNCTHVWNYETATAHLFPSLSRSLRKAAFGYCMDDRGALHFRQMLPAGIERFGTAAADGQMGQIIKIYIDWQLSGDMDFLREYWPKAKKAIEFAWVPGGWDANRDGVLEGVQHNTYDVEFYGPNPQCGVYYLGALRAAEEMARAMGDTASAAEYHRLFESGSRWIDANLFNGEYYEQRVIGYPPDKIAPALRAGMGSDDTQHPQYQVGTGCLVDQLVGQYLADVAGLGPLLDPEKIQKTLDSIYRYNHKASLAQHDTVQRTFALNDESAMVICDYARSERPQIPFPYYAEVMTGFEYSAANLMLYSGMTDRGVACVQDIRKRYDGVRRNPWDEAECGHHYARAMASWSGVLALSGFRYRGPERAVIAVPRISFGESQFRCFWSASSGWGTFSLVSRADVSQLKLSVDAGSLAARSFEFPSSGKSDGLATLDGKPLAHTIERRNGHVVFVLAKEAAIAEGGQILLEG